MDPKTESEDRCRIGKVVADLILDRHREDQRNKDPGKRNVDAIGEKAAPEIARG